MHACACALDQNDACALPPKTTMANGSVDDVLHLLERARQGLPLVPQAPLPLRVHPTDPRFLRYDDALVVGGEGDDDDDAARATAFLNRNATPSELLLALRLGMHRLLFRFPRLAFATPALVTATVCFGTTEMRVRRRTRKQASDDARSKRAHMHLALKLCKTNRDDYDLFSEAAVGAALTALVASSSRPCHLRFAYQFLLCAPAVRVATHPLVDAIAQSVKRLRSRALLVFAERLTKRVAHPDATDFRHECGAALGEGVWMDALPSSSSHALGD